MTCYIPEDDAERQPHGTLRLLWMTEQPEPQALDFWSDDAPAFHLAVLGSAVGSRLPQEVLELLHEMRRSTGIAYFLLKSSEALRQDKFEEAMRCVGQKVSRTIVWLGPSADNSDAAIRLLSRLQNRSPNLIGRRVWSRREGQALLALAERPTWKHLLPRLAPAARDLWLCAGKSSISWTTLLHFRQLLADIETQGRMEHHHFANALQASIASEAISTFVREVESRSNRTELRYPPPLDATVLRNEGLQGLQNLSSQLDHSIAAVATRWTMLSNEVQTQPTPELLSEADLDAEIARYTQMLQQMDILEMDLQHLDELATVTSIHCRQAEAHTPRASPEIMP